MRPFFQIAVTGRCIRRVELYSFVICMFLLSSCNEKNDSGVSKVIVIDPGHTEVVNLSSFVKGIKYIKLEVLDDFALGPGSIIIKDDLIFYYDFISKVLHLFDFNGKHINSLSKIGESPEEYKGISIFTIENNTKTIEIFDITGMQIVKYKIPSFEFINQRKVDSYIHLETGLKLGKNKYLISTEGHLNIFKDYRTNAEFLLYDSNLVSKVYFDRKYKNENHNSYFHYGLFMNKIVRNDLGEVLVSVNFDNTIYKFENEEFNPVFNVVYSNNLGTDNEGLLNMTRKEQFQYFYKSGNFKRLASFPHLAINNSNILVINYLFNTKEKFVYQDSFRHYIYIKKSEKFFNASSIVNDITTFPEKIYLTTFDTYNSDFIYTPWYDKYLVSIFYPASELKYNENIVLSTGDSVKFDDNPIILLMEVK